MNGTSDPNPILGRGTMMTLNYGLYSEFGGYQKAAATCDQAWEPM